MMALLFLLLFAALVASYCKLRQPALWCLTAGWVLSAALFWYHVTETLAIRW